MPDDRIRPRARRVKAEEVVYLKFIGTHFCEHGKPGRGLFVDDPALIHRFLAALQNAEKPTPETDRELWAGGDATLDGLLIFHRARDGEREVPVEAEHFRFNPIVPDTCFGPRFQAALRSLETYQARRVRELAKEVAPDVTRVTVDFIFGRALDVSDPMTVVKVVSALGQADERAYSCTLGSTWREGVVTFYLRDGQQVWVDVNFDTPSRGMKRGGGAWFKVLMELLKPNVLRSAQKGLPRMQ